MFLIYRDSDELSRGLAMIRPVLDVMENSPYFKTPESKVDLCILVIDSLLIAENFADAEIFYKTASRYHRALKDNIVKLKYNVCGAQLADFQRKYIDSASMLLRVINADPNDIYNAFSEKFDNNGQVDDIIVTFLRFASNSIIVSEAAPQV